MKITINDLNRWRSCAALDGCLILVSAFVFLLPINQMVEGAESSTFHFSYFRQQFYTKWSLTKTIPPRPTPIKICYSDECRQAAQDIARKMNSEVKPCDDFYQFACGNYTKQTQIPEDKVAVNTFSELSDKLQEQLKDIITAKRDEAEPKHLKLPNFLYQACLNETLIELLGTKRIEEMSDSLGGWPVIVGSSWDSNNTWSWQESVKKLARLGFSLDYIVTFSIAEDLKNSTRRILILDQSTTFLDRIYAMKGLNDPIVSAYYNYMVDTAVFLGAKKQAAEKELKESLQFEMNLVKIGSSQEKRRNSNDLYNLRTIKQLQESYSYVNWLDYINGLLPAGLKVDENEVINVLEPSFFHRLGELLHTTEKRAIANYMMWRMHEESVPFLTKDIREIRLRYDTAASGSQKQVPRWKECVDLAAKTLPISVGSLYVRKHFNEASKASALEMFNNIRGVFSQIIDKVDWMNQKTKQEAKRKLHALASHIGYPDEMLDNNKLEEHYRNLEMDPHKYLESMLNMTAFRNDFTFNELRLPVNKTAWIEHEKTAVVNAFYSTTQNSIEFPAGILQGHFFSGQRPKYMNYGAIGWVIGQKITHGFDDVGRQFDLEGNLIDWWQPGTKEAFLEKAKCIVEQYGNFTDQQTGLNLNGINTQGENIADNGGIKMAYLAYKKYVTEKGEEPRLPDLNYTPNQLFWISAAQTWCAKAKTEDLQNTIITDTHSPSEFRVLGSSSNMKGFSRDFQCHRGTPMNPVRKCEVW